ncbi:MAG: SCO family protein [Burkholderiaceae bacterium]|nr:SCO family protein [Burkholderiaceae bacterium]
MIGPAILGWRSLGMALVLWLTLGPAFAAGPDARVALAASQAAIGRRVGDYFLRDSTGQAFRLGSLAGRPYLLGFVYTGCFQSCPVATRFLADAVRKAREALGRDSFEVITIGFNQPFDGPEAMAGFARQAGVSDAHWRFASVEGADVAALAADFGFSFERTPKGFDHITQVSVVGPDGVVYRQVYGESFELPLLVGPLRELIMGQTRESLSPGDLWRRVKLYCTVYDPVTGAYRANYALFFEIFVGASVLGVLGWTLWRGFRRGAMRPGRG